jgi:hypothetical protein
MFQSPPGFFLLPTSEFVTARRPKLDSFSGVVRHTQVLADFAGCRGVVGDNRRTTGRGLFHAGTVSLNGKQAAKRLNKHRGWQTNK